MPSPFPGMDPYLEDRTLWPDVHHRLISVISEFLSPKLRPAYFAQIEERVYVMEDDGERHRLIVPDVSVIELDTFEDATGGATAVAVAPVFTATAAEIDVHEAYIEIRDAASRVVVTVIEVLSPANKERGSSGFESYERKRNEVLRSRANFVEIDLLRDGFRPPFSGGFPKTEYRVHVSKPDERPNGWVWPIRLADRLPTIEIPLRTGMASVPLDLQHLIELTYERAGYDLILDYSKPPPVPLSSLQGAWTNRVLAVKTAVSG